MTCVLLLLMVVAPGCSTCSKDDIAYRMVQKFSLSTRREYVNTATSTWWCEDCGS